jgi:hypothetical protein
MSLLETRVLGVLIEKERTVPDTYPLTLNALLSGCNQKTSRDPVVNASETEVQAALDSLKRMSFAIESSGGRVARYSHNAERVLRLPAPACSLLAVLMLRGPQTSGELRINCERLHRFPDISAVEELLAGLAERSAGGLVAKLPRQAGTREVRWAHLLSGAPPAADMEPSGQTAVEEGPGMAVSELATLKANVARLQDEVAAQRALLERVCADLGIKGQGGAGAEG